MNMLTSATMKLVCFSIVCSLCVIAVNGCANGPNGKPTLMNQSLDRTETHLASLRVAAKSGDGTAAYELSQYYRYVAFDFKQQRYWLEYAAKLRYTPAVVSLGNLLVESPSAEDRLRGKKLLRQART